MCALDAVKLAWEGGINVPSRLRWTGSRVFFFDFWKRNYGFNSFQIQVWVDF